jgi:DNA-binding transcriptional LysR family regulator
LPAIGPQDRVVAVAVSHPLARQKTVSVEDLAGQPAARPPASFPPALWEAFVPANTPSGKPIPPTHVTRSLHEALALAARGPIVHPTVASAAQLLRRDDIVLVPIIGLPPIRPGLIWRSACHSARIRALATTARSIHPAKPPNPQLVPGSTAT